jgi:hypothetical protein
MTRRANSIALWSVLLAGITLAVPATAYAKDKPSDWATSGTPLAASGYGSTATGYGNFRVTNTSNGTTARAAGYNKVRNADNHKAFFDMQPQSNAGRCAAGTSLGIDILGTGGAFGKSYSCTQAFYDKGDKKQSKHTSSSTFVYTTADVDADGNANIMRAKVRECLDVPWRSDPCTGWGISGADTY